MRAGFLAAAVLAGAFLAGADLAGADLAALFASGVEAPSGARTASAGCMKEGESVGSSSAT